MRLSPEQVDAIRDCASTIAGEDANVWLFGSRLDDYARGGDVDLMLELQEAVAEPAPLAARLAARVSRAMYGRKVDVIIKAPNLLNLPIHDVAIAEGVLL